MENSANISIYKQLHLVSHQIKSILSSPDYLLPNIRVHLPKKGEVVRINATVRRTSVDPMNAFYISSCIYLQKYAHAKLFVHCNAISVYEAYFVYILHCRIDIVHVRMLVCNHLFSYNKQE